LLENKKILKRIVITISSVCLAVVILFSPFLNNVFNFNYYMSLYERNAVFEKIDKNDAERLTESMFEFFKYNKDFKSFELKNNLKFFNENEIGHLADVRIVFNNIFKAYFISLIIFIIFAGLLFEKKRLIYLKNLTLIFLTASILVITLMLLLVSLSSNFDYLFEKFHLIFFPQGNWAFPEDSLLITLLPFNFFYSFFLKIAIGAAVISLIIFIISIISYILLNKKIKKVYK